MQLLTPDTHLNIVWTEEELSIEVRFFNGVHVCDKYLPAFSTSHAHHSPVLQHFTANSSSSHLHLKNSATIYLQKQLSQYIKGEIPKYNTYTTIYSAQGFN